MIETLPFPRKLTNEETLLLHAMCRKFATCLYEFKDNERDIPFNAPGMGRMEFDEKIVALYQICRMAQSDTEYPRMQWVDATLYSVLQFTSHDLGNRISLKVPLFGFEDGEICLGSMLIDAMLSHVRTIESLEEREEFLPFEEALLKAYRKNPEKMKISNKNLRDLVRCFREDWFGDYDFMSGSEMTELPPHAYAEINRQIGINPAYHFDNAPACPSQTVRAAFRYFHLKPPRRSKFKE